MSEISYQILTNLSCNLDCSYCYEKKSKKMNKFEDVKVFLDYVFNRDKNKYDYVMIDYIGGETFLSINLLNQVNEYVLENMGKYGFKGAKFAISTNGTLLKNDKVKEYLLKYKEGIYLGISIDGTKRAHDKFRIYRKDKSGSYDDAVSGLRWALDNLNPKQINVKATFTSQTLSDYEAGVKSIFAMGAKRVHANFIFEESWDLKASENMALIFMRLMDYFYKTGLYKEVEFGHFFKEGKLFKSLNPLSLIKPTLPDTNNCGSCKEMVCLGFDKKVYGCNRFASMNKPNKEIGYFTSSGEFMPLNTEFKNEVLNQYKLLAKECKECVIYKNCASCVAIAYESNQGVKDYLAKRSHCGLTHAKVIAIEYLDFLIRSANNV